MTEKFEVGKIYRNRTRGYTVKCLCIASNGNVFLECIKGGQFVNPGDSWIATPSVIEHYKEYKEPRRKKYKIIVFENLKTKLIYFSFSPCLYDADTLKEIDIIEGEWIEKETSSS